MMFAYVSESETLYCSESEKRTGLLSVYPSSWEKMIYLDEILNQRVKDI